MDHENEIVKDTQTLHSDMQTLVYENYNKFISATETIRKVCLQNLINKYLFIINLMTYLININ